MGIVNLYWPDAGMEQAALRFLNQRGDRVPEQYFFFRWTYGHSA